ncbi:MAG: methionyl-tRNA formyltransferase [Acidobacteriaceae bacterium]
MKLIFCGTPRFAVPTLSKLVQAGFSVVLVVTQPDKPRGRGLELSASPVKQRAVELGLPLAQPAAIKNNEEFRQQLSAIAPEGIIVVGYGRIIPQWMIDLPPLGNINLHASLLPKYRGAAPIQWAIAKGEKVTGVTTMRIDAGLDTGDILLQQELPLNASDTSETIGPRLADIGAELMIQTLRGMKDGKVQARVQDSSRATLAPILKKEDGRILFSRTAYEIVDRMRGFRPWPGAFTIFRERLLNVLTASAVDRKLPPGEIFVEGDQVLVGCGEDTALALGEVQVDGKKRLSARDFANGYHLKSGQKIDS